MILLDRNFDLINIVATDVSQPAYITIQSEFSGENYTFELGEDLSGYPERYNLFQLDMSLFKHLSGGRYSYVIHNYDGDIYQSGLSVIKDKDTSFIQPNLN